ncbi:feruloyl-CoA synthase [Sphaerisporangium perillae]|uniref:feruloyl-CoA synthase n=1 Tax=Sphaerisporangium perillae TaxID=2935860 RepID=UPI00200D4F7E|nr:feruloyl-CoA synthase [Sphaerisporangium perillae]
MLLESATPLQPSPGGVVEMLRGWAALDPEQMLVAQRGPDGTWWGKTYSQALAAADSIGQALHERGLSSERPLMVLSGNSVGHLLMTLGAMTAGIPVVPISVAYSLQSRDHARIKMIGELVRPGAVYAEDVEPFRPAVSALGGDPMLISAVGGPAEHSLDALLSTAPGREVADAGAQIADDTVAKILFTSGSTGMPKGVITTHGMLCANQQMMRQVWPFLTGERPVLVDWLPWSHTFGGNHNVNMVLANGGTLHIDDGRPTPGLLARSLANYRDVSPTLAFNVPSGWAQLVPALERDHDLAERFFDRIRLLFNAAAALPSTLRHRLKVLAREATGRDIPVTGSWGTTETAPAATTAHFDYTDARCIGVPLPGVTLKLVPADEDSYEIRVRGKLITPGYHRRPDLSDAAFDEEGFYCPGDAVSFADPADPNAGLLFRGRLAEDFKLSTGTFVRVGSLRTALLSAAPVLSDAVIVGENRGDVCALAWLNATEAGRVLGELPDTQGEVLYSAELAAYLAPILGELNASAGSASRIQRLLVMARPATLDAGEITDKGYVNQRRVLAQRAELVGLLYRDAPPGEVIVSSRKEGS